MLTFHAAGDWAPGQVHHLHSDNARLIIPEVEAMIDNAWTQALAKPGVLLFDGPMVRLESWQSTADELTLSLGRTTYKAFLGTNLYHPTLSDQYGRDVLANPVGVSPTLETTDGWLMFGRRNSSVAYYPDRIHPFAGALEPKDAMDIFSAVRRELREELGLTSEVTDIHCTGIAEDQSIRQPELIFRTGVARTRAEIEASVDRKEHHDAWSVRADPESIIAAIADSAQLTPVAVAALLLWGRVKAGDGWFAEASRPFL